MSLLTNISTTMQLSVVQLEFQIDDNSPLIRYNPPDAWLQVNNSSDQLVAKYYGETLTRASAPNAQATFSFNGTGFSIFGGRRKIYAPFKLQIDGKTSECDAYTTTEDQAAVRLCSKFNLTNTNHTATLISSDKAPFDIDKITWTTEMNSQHGRAPLETITVDDADPAFQWNPPNAWSTNPDNQDQFHGETGHSTAVSGGSVTFSFKGEIVSIFGSIGPQNSPYTAEVDNSPPVSFNATTDYSIPRSLLFFADNLGPGDHVVRLTNSQSQGSGLVMEIDYAEVHQFMPNAVAPVIPTTSSSTGVATAGSHRTNVAIILSAIFGTIVISVMLWGFWYLWRRKRDIYARLQEEVKIDNAFDWASSSQQVATLHSSDPITSSHKRGYGYHQASDSMASLLERELSPHHGRSESTDTESLRAERQSRLRPLRLSAKIFGLNRNRQTQAILALNHHRHNPRPSVDSPEETTLTEEDYGHVPLPGELPPPTYSQATAPSSWRSLRGRF